MQVAVHETRRKLLLQQQERWERLFFELEELEKFVNGRSMSVAAEGKREKKGRKTVTGVDSTWWKIKSNFLLKLI